MSRTYASRKTKHFLSGVWFDSGSASIILGTVYCHFYPNDKDSIHQRFPYEMTGEQCEDFANKVRSLTDDDWKKIFENCRNCFSPSLTHMDCRDWTYKVSSYLRNLKDGFVCLG